MGVVFKRHKPGLSTTRLDNFYRTYKILSVFVESFYLFLLVCFEQMCVKVLLFLFSVIFFSPFYPCKCIFSNVAMNIYFTLCDKYTHLLISAFKARKQELRVPYREFRVHIHQLFSRALFFSNFLAHLSIEGSRGAFRMVMCSSSVLRRASSPISLNIFSSQNAGPIWTKLGRNVPWEVLFKNYSQYLIPSKTLVAMATKWNFLSNSLKIFSSGTAGRIVK